MIDFKNIKSLPEDPDRPEPIDMIATCDCGYSAKASTFEFEYEQESWEMPEFYKVLICPKGTDDCCVDQFS